VGQPKNVERVSISVPKEVISRARKAGVNVSRAAVHGIELALRGDADATFDMGGMARRLASIERLIKKERDKIG
jgi:post-segregation antitoxin (ccd killing protein)